MKKIHNICLVPQQKQRKNINSFKLLLFEINIPELIVMLQLLTGFFFFQFIFAYASCVNLFCFSFLFVTTSLCFIVVVSRCTAYITFTFT